MNLQGGNRNSSGNRPEALRRALVGAVTYLCISAASALVLFAAYSSTYVVEAGHEVLLLRFGRWVRTEREPGLHLKAPWPVDRAIPVKTCVLRILELDLLSPGEAGSEETHIPRLVLTGDKNILECKFGLAYTITNPRDYHYAVRTEDVDNIVSAVTYDSIVREMANRNVDNARTQERDEIGIAVLDRAEKLFQKGAGRGALPLGIALDVGKSAGLREVHVPEDVRPMFEEVLTERIRVRSQEAAATRRAQRELAKAKAYRQESIRKAEAQAATVVCRAEANAAAFQKWAEVVERYRNDGDPRTDPMIIRERLYRQTMARIFPKLDETILLPDTGGPTRIRLYLLDKAQGIIAKPED